MINLENPVVRQLADRELKIAYPRVLQPQDPPADRFINITSVAHKGMLSRPSGWLDANWHIMAERMSRSDHLLRLRVHH